MGSLKVITTAPLALAAALGTAAAQLDVEVRVEGIEKSDLRKKVREVSSVYRAEDDAYRRSSDLRRAEEADVVAMRAALQSLGYYAAEVAYEVERDEGAAIVVFAVTPGVKFKITEYAIEYQVQKDIDPPLGRPETLRAAGLRGGGDPTGARLREIEAGLIAKLWNDGYPGAETLPRRVEADFGAGTAKAVFPIRSGPLSFYGDVRVVGSEDVNDSYVARLKTFEEGEIYSRADIDEYQEALADTGLFREVQVAPAPPGVGGVTDVLVTVVERERRTIQGGLSFGTDIGPGVSASWENRNLFGGGERGYVRAAAAQPLQQLEVVFADPLPRLPGFWELSALFENANTDAFEAQSGTVGAALNKYWFERNLLTTGGLRYQYAQIDVAAGAGDTPPEIPFQEDTTETFSLVSVPLAAIWNNETNELNPIDGFRARVLVEPFFGDIQFNQVQLGGASRFGFGERSGLIGRSTYLAGRFLVGATYGADRADIPATQRYFAGGGGSIRGYGFQDAGPLNVVERDDGLFYRDGTPFAFELDDDGLPTDDPILTIGSIGGASIVEGNLEARRRITDNIQLAAFVDGGTVFESQTPDFSGDILVGAGIGVRYFTPVGPLRVDVAIPLNRRKLVAQRQVFDDDGQAVLNEAGDVTFDDETVFQDDLLGVYIALGQPF